MCLTLIYINELTKLLNLYTQMNWKVMIEVVTKEIKYFSSKCVNINQLPTISISKDREQPFFTLRKYVNIKTIPLTQHLLLLTYFEK